MAIHAIIEKQCTKYLMPSEEILATLLSDPVFGTEHRYCVTNMRLFEICKKSVFSWEINPFPLLKVRELNFTIDEGVWKSTISIHRNGKDKEKIGSVNKSDAREFMSALEYATTQNLELASQQTKTCPECVEQVRLLAKKCKHCGFRF